MSSTKSKHPIRKALLITGAIILGLVIIIIAFISPIAKYVIEKYDEKILGRQITLDWIYLNPFTGYAHLSNLVLYEQNKDSVFVKAGSANIDFAMFKLLKKTYEISYVTLKEVCGPELFLAVSLLPLLLKVCE